MADDLRPWKVRKDLPEVVPGPDAPPRRSAPKVETRAAREALSMALGMQSGASTLAGDQGRELARRHRALLLRRVLLLVVLVAALATFALLEPISSWWTELMDTLSGASTS